MLRPHLLQPQFDHLKSSHRAVTFDLRGCGRSDKPDAGYDIPTLTDYVAGQIDMLPATRDLFNAFVAGLQDPAAAAVREAYVADMFEPADDQDRKRQIIQTMCSAPDHVALGQFRGVLDWNGVGAMKLGNAPVLVIKSGTGGSNDPARLRALRSNVEIGVTVGAGHFNQLEVPEQVNPMIERFVAGLP